MAAISLQGYQELLSPAAHRRTAVAGLVARLPQAVLGFSALLLVQQETGSFAVAGVVSGVVVATSAVSTPVLGRLADQRGQAQVLRWAAALNAVAVTALVVSATGSAPTALVVASAAAVGLTTLPIGALTRARWSRTVGQHPRRLASAYALEGVLDELVWVGGPAAAAAVAAASGAGWGLALGCAAGLVGALALAGRPDGGPGPDPVLPHRATGEGGGGGSTSPGHADAPARHRAAALQVLRSQLSLPVVSPPVIAVLVALAATGVVFGAADISAVALSTQLGRAELAGVALGAGSLGAVGGGVLVGALPPPRSPAAAAVVTAGLVGIGWAPLALTSSFSAVVVLCFLGGCAFAPFSTTANRLVASVSPQHRLTEALAWLSTAVVAGMAVGSTAAGFLIDRGGASSGYLLVACAAFIPVVVTSAGALAVRRRPGRRSPPPATTPRPADDDDEARTCGHPLARAEPAVGEDRHPSVQPPRSTT